MLDFRVYKLLAGIFTPEFNIVQPLKIANIVVELLGDFVGEEPSILPIPKDAPPEIPRILFSSSDKKWSLNISPNRTNMFYNISPTSTKREDEIKVEEFTEIASEFLSHYQKKLITKVQRIAFVTERIIIKDDALNYLLTRFVKKEQISKDRPFSNSKKFEIHSLKAYGWQKFNINSWVRLKFLSVKTDEGEMEPGLIVINDLNTQSIEEAPETSYIVNDIKRYFQNITKHQNEILKLYFD